MVTSGERKSHYEMDKEVLLLTLHTSCLHFSLCVYVWKSESESQPFSHVQLFATPWAVARQAPLSMGILQARILEWATMPSSRGSSWPRDRTQVSLIAGRFFTREAHSRSLLFFYFKHWVSLVAQWVKNPPAMRETWIWSLGWEDPWRRAWQPTPIFLPGESP